MSVHVKIITNYCLIWGLFYNECYVKGNNKESGHPVR